MRPKFAMDAPSAQAAHTRRFGANQIAFVLFVLVVVVVWNGTYYFLSRSQNEPRYSYQGTSGPFALESLGTADTDPVAGMPISSTKPGKIFGWTTTLCIKDGITGLGVVELVRISPGDEQVINRVETPIPPTAHRCGSRTVARLVPPDAPPGYYEIRRELVLAPNGRPIQPISLPPLHIRIEP